MLEMLKLRDEKYFTAGLAGAVFALYAASMFTYFKNSDTPAMSQNGITIESTQVSDMSSRAVMANSEQLINIMEKTKSHDTFSPLSHPGDITIPGALCNLTEQNVDYNHNFSNLPQDCSEGLSEY
tara:strand:+ start:834 stop:1208 length:375 start_codon:yes stop_codon:yes gene_type:complete